MTSVEDTESEVGEEVSQYLQAQWAETVEQAWKYKAGVAVADPQGDTAVNMRFMKTLADTIAQNQIGQIMSVAKLQ